MDQPPADQPPADRDPDADTPDGDAPGDASEGEAALGDGDDATRRRRWPWIVLGVIVVIAAAVGAVVGIFTAQAADVRDDLLSAKKKLATLADAASDGDAERMQAIGAEVLALTTRADEEVRGPLWKAASSIPTIGVNVTAVQKATEATHILVRGALPAGLDLLETMQPDKLKVSGGGLDLAPFQKAERALPAIEAVFARARQHVSGIDRDSLLPVVDDAIGQLLSVIRKAGPTLESVEDLLPVALRMAGSDEPRNYLLVFANNAEIRATGGNASTSTILHVDAGHIEKVEDETITRFNKAGLDGSFAADLPAETLGLYESDFATHAQNFTRTPDFPTTADIYAQLWTKTNGTALDGVISIDPVALSYLLAATGPVPLADGSEITADNATELLLSDAYERFGTDGLAADAFFADVASRVFDTVAGGSWDPLEMLDQLQRAVDDHRINAWFAREDENELAVQFAVDGALTADNATATQVGLFVNDASYAKLNFYLSTAISVTCDAAARTMTTSMTLTSTVPSTPLSGYTLAHRTKSLGLARTTMVLDILSVAPPGASILSVTPTTSDFAGWDRGGMEKGHEVQSRSIALKKGETQTVSFTSTLPEGPLGPLAVRFSPTVTDTPVSVDAACDGLIG